MLKEKQITGKKQKQVTSLFLIYHSRSYCLFIIKRFAQINIFKLSDDILHVILLNKLLQAFVVCAVFSLAGYFFIELQKISGLYPINYP